MDNNLLIQNSYSNVIEDDFKGCAITEFKPKIDFKLDIIGTLELKAKNGSFIDFFHFVKWALEKVEGFEEWFDAKFKSEDFSIVVKVGKGYYIDMTLLRNSYKKLKKVTHD